MAPSPTTACNKVRRAMQSTELKIDVTRAVDLGEPVHLAATLHLPDGMDAAPGHLLFALHGGGYTRAYWDPAFTDASYSFARFFTGRGKAVLAVDMLGMGESSRPEPESRLSRAIIAAAHAAALAHVRTRFDSSISVSGIGHSMGGMMIIDEAATHGGFDRVAVLGWANEAMVLGDIDVATLQAGLIPSGYLAGPRERMRKLFYWPDVPEALIVADEAAGSTTPATLGRSALTPGIVHAAAAGIAVPVLVVQSEIDTSPSPDKEPAYFSTSPAVELQRLSNAAHCQNFASTRLDHWRALDEWIERTG